MTRYGIQKKVFHPKAKGYVWVWVESPEKKPYLFDEERAATKFMRLIFPGADPDFIRTNIYGEAFS